MLRKILISTSSFAVDDPAPLEELRNRKIEFELNLFGRKLDVEETKKLLSDKDGVIAGTELLDKEVLGAAPNLRVISRCGTGMDNVDLPEAKKRGITVFNTPDVHVAAVAELTLAGILSLTRKLNLSDTKLKAGSWSRQQGRDLSGCMVGLIGLGKVGKSVASMLRAFSAHVQAFDIFHDDLYAKENAVRYVGWNELLKTSDIISLHMSYSKAVHHILNSESFGLLKRDVIVINTSRGGLIDEHALYEFLKSNPDSSAFLDTFETEPYKGKLAELNNVLLSPHIGTFTRQTRSAMEMEATLNLIGYFETLK